MSIDRNLALGLARVTEAAAVAAAIRCLGGFMQGRLLFMSEEERTRVRSMGITDFSKTHKAEEMAQGEVFFAATGVTNGDLVRGGRYFPNGAKTHTVVMRSKSHKVRFLETIHYFDHKPGYIANNL